LRRKSEYFRFGIFTPRTIRTREQAIAQISRLPDADQEEIGRKLLSHVEKLNALRDEIDRGRSHFQCQSGLPALSSSKAQISSPNLVLHSV
jgi:hypothetical protein